MHNTARTLQRISAQSVHSAGNIAVCGMQSALLSLLLPPLLASYSAWCGYSIRAIIARVGLQVSAIILYQCISHARSGGALPAMLTVLGYFVSDGLAGLLSVYDSATPVRDPKMDAILMAIGLLSITREGTVNQLMLALATYTVLLPVLVYSLSSVEKRLLLQWCDQGKEEATEAGTTKDCNALQYHTSRWPIGFLSWTSVFSIAPTAVAIYRFFQEQ